MDPRYTTEMLKHLEKQNELLKDAHDSMSHELHKLQVEEEMLMRKFFEFMASQGLAKKNEGSSNALEGGQITSSSNSTTLHTNTSTISDGNGNEYSTELVPVKEHQ